MATKILKSIKGKRVRITRLDECGDVVVGSCTTVVSDCFVSVTLTPEIEAGEEYLVKSAWGDLCISDRDEDRIKWVNVSIEFAELDPDALDIMTNAQSVVSSGNTIGASYGQQTQAAGFALEVWTKRTGADCTTGGSQEWGYFVVPFVRNGRVDGDLVIENGALTVTVVGEGFPAPATWDETPYASNPFVEPFPAGDLFGMVVTTVQPPSATVGCVAYSGS